jgi:hypothetical protein
MFNDNLIRRPVNGTAAIVASQKGCSTELTPEQERENIISHMEQVDEQIKNLPSNMKKKDPIKKKLGLRKFELCNQLAEVNLKIKKININKLTRDDFQDCVFHVMKEQLSSFQYRRIIKSAEILYQKDLNSAK